MVDIDPVRDPYRVVDYRKRRHSWHRTEWTIRCGIVSIVYWGALIYIVWDLCFREYFF